MDNKPWIIAHRGASAYAPENSMHAFELAVGMAADFLEVDVRKTEDGVLVAHHNRGVRLGRKRFWIDQLTLEEAKIIKPNLVTIEELVKKFGQKVGFDLDLKQGALEEDLVTLFKKYSFKNQLVVTSSNFAILWRFKELYPTCATTFWLRTHDPRDFLSSFVARTLYRVLPYIARFILPRIIVWRVKNRLIDAVSPDPPSLVTKSFIENMHSQGVLVFTAPVNSAHDAKRLLDHGVDGMITDRPDIVRKVISGEVVPQRRALPIRIIRGIGRRVKRVVGI